MLDVAVLGGGMAGGLLARQLRRQLPGVQVALFERSTERSFKVGESTVEIGSHYLNRRLGLSRYLYEHHLPKNGLRFFFDDAERGAELPSMSEIGTVNLPFHPSFQLDRARFDADLLEMNANDGVEVRRGARVTRLELGSGGEPHRFDVEAGGRVESLSARWLVDATGRSSLVARERGWRVREDDHPVQSVWGRFEGLADPDDWTRFGSDFGARVRHTSRGISTLHFCYPDYWIWLIPLRGGLTSIGVVGNPPGQAAALRTEGGFRAFLEGHRALASLLGEAKSVDMSSLRHLSYGTRHFFHSDRIGLTGEAAAFADPLYSPGTDFIALANDFLCDLIASDLGDASSAPWLERLERYDAFMRFRHEAAMRLYRGLYGGVGSYEFMRLKWDLDIGCYLNLWLWPYMRDQYRDEVFLRRHLRQQRFVLQPLSNFSDVFRKVEAHLRESGNYYRGNLGRFSHGLEHIDFLEKVGLPRKQRAELETTERIFDGVRRRALGLLDRPDEATSERAVPLATMMTPHPIV
jgi:flavin-dependent dehydrogenase